MAPMSLTSATNGLTAAVVVRDPTVRGSLVRALDECRVHFVERRVEQLARADEKPDVVCTCSSVAAAVLGLNIATVIVTRGLSVSDEVWVELVRRRPVVISHIDLTPVMLLEGRWRRWRRDLVN